MELLFCSSNVFNEDVRSSTWVCRAVRAFCVVARSARRREMRSLGACSGSVAVALLLVGVLIVASTGCGDGETTLLCWPFKDAARSASLVSISHQYHQNIESRLFHLQASIYALCAFSRASRSSRAAEYCSIQSVIVLFPNVDDFEPPNNQNGKAPTA